jgi:hypothetical protein
MGTLKGKKLKRDLLEEIDKLDRLSELNGLTALDIEKKNPIPATTEDT